MKTVVFTSAAINYLPKVRKLCASIRQHHPEWEIVLALADRDGGAVDFSVEPIDEVLPIDQLDIPDRERWSYFHTIVELSTAIKPFVLKQLLARPDVERVLYFDPDMVLFSRLDDLLESLDKGNIVLTPHQTSPETTLDAIRDNEIASLKHGVFNLGFLGVRTSVEGMRFLNWWAERLRYFCHDDIAGGLFTDQRWMDLVPAFFEDIAILREPIYNVATWNLTHRPVAGSLERGLTVNGEPLSFYHFSGFDGGAQEVMLNKYADSGSALFDLRRWYIAECRRMGQEQLGNRRCRYETFSNGERISRAQRILYRSRPDLQQAFSSPFHTDGDSYYRWHRLNIASADDAAFETEATLRAQLNDARRELDLIQRSRSWRLARAFARLFNAFR